MKWSAGSMRDNSGEKATLQTYLNHYRVTLQLKCEGLSPAQMGTRALPPSRMSPEGIVRHLAQREHHWFQRVLDERPALPELWPEDPDQGFAATTGTEEGVSLAWRTWYDAVTFSQRWVADCPQELFHAQVAAGPRMVSVREVLTHLVEEYARHMGHIDLLVERLDGRTGP